MITIANLKPGTYTCFLGARARCGPELDRPAVSHILTPTGVNGEADGGPSKLGALQPE